MKNRRSRRVCHLLVLVLVFTLLIACVSEQSLNEATEEPVTPAVRHPTISPTATARPTATPLHVSPTPEPTVTLTPSPEGHAYTGADDEARTHKRRLYQRGSQRRWSITLA